MISKVLVMRQCNNNINKIRKNINKSVLQVRPQISFVKTNDQY